MFQIPDPLTLLEATLMLRYQLAVMVYPQFIRRHSHRHHLPNEMLWNRVAVGLKRVLAKAGSGPLIPDLPGANVTIRRIPAFPSEAPMLSVLLAEAG